MKDRWDLIVKEYMEKGTYAQTELRTKFLESRCPDKGNIREFLEGLQIKKEELAQVGVEIDDKDYLLTIISSLPYHLSNFASAQLSAAKMFVPTKSIKPDVLMTLLMEEAERQKAQLARCAFRKGKEEHNETLGVTDGSRPRKGKAKANVTCWNCNTKGHYSNECEKPKEDDKSRDTGIAAGAESEDEGAWAAKLIENEIALPEMLPSVSNEADCSQVDVSDESDWFYEVNEGDDELNGEMGYSGGAVVDVFNMDAAPGGAIANVEMEGTVFKDSGITGHVWPVCDDGNKIEGADRLSGTPIARLEGEYRSGRTTSELSSRMPDLDLLENLWIDLTMEWHIHTITEQIDEAKTCPPDNHKGGEDDPVTETNEECSTKKKRQLKVINAPGIIYEINLLVTCFEGEEDNRAETNDLHVICGSPAPIESLVVEAFNLVPQRLYECPKKLSPSVVNLSVGCTKFLEAENDQGIIRLDTYEGAVPPKVDVAERIGKDAHGGVGLPMVGVAQLVRPPGCDFEGSLLLSSPAVLVDPVC